MHDSHPKRRTRPCVYYQQGICNRPNCNFSHEISTNLSSNSDTTSPLPGSISTPSVQSQLGDEHDRGVLRSRPCRYFAKGRCTAGDSCRWSHDEEAFLEDGVMHPSAYEDPELVTPGFKLVPKSYRTLPCARYEKGHCMYGDACTFIHSTPAASSAPTPSARDPRELDSLGPSPPAIMIKPHSHHPSPIRPHLPSPSMSTNNVHQLSSPLATTSITANGSSLPLAQTISRELPPPSSHFGGTNWAISTASQQQPSSMSAIGRTSTPVFAGSPLLNSLGNEWSHPQPSPLHQSVSSTSQMQQQSRSPFLYTFGEIAPPAKDGPSSFSGNSALTQPRQDSPAPKSLGLGLNGASLATQGAIGLGTSPSANGMLAPGGPSNGTTNSNVAPLSVANLISSRAGLPISSTSSPAIGLRRSLHGTGTGGGPGSDIGVSVARRLMGNGTGHSRVPSYDTDEPDFPSISYNEFTVDGENEKDDLASVGAGSVGASSGVGLKLGTNGGGTLYGGNGDENGDSRASIQRWAGHGRMGSLGGSGRPMRYGPGGAYGDLNSYDEQSYRISYKTRPCKFFVAGSRCPSGQQCTFIHDPSSVRSGPTNGGPGYGLPPGTYGPPGMPAITNPEQHPLYRTRECKYHLAGHCHQEESCAFKHTGPAGQGREYENWEGFSLQIRDYENGDDRGPFRARLCKWYLKGNCFHGDNCTYLHSTEFVRPPCMFWKNGTGNCLNGDNCRFSHDIMDEINDQQHLSPPVEGLGDQRPSALANGYAYAAKPSNVANHYSTTIYPSSDQQQTLPTVTTEDLSDLNGPDEFDHLTTTFADGLAVDDRGRMDLALSEGEDDDEEDDVIVMKTNIDDNGDKPFERLFSTLTVSAPNAAASQ